MKIVVLTNDGSVFGKNVLAHFQKLGIPLAGIVVVHQPLSYHWSLLKNVIKRVGVADAIVFAIRRLCKRYAPTPDYRSFTSHVAHTRGSNTPETIDALVRMQPDLLILGQTGIVRGPVLDTAKIGTLNAHPGILPFYRGIDCARWAIYNNEPERVGATVHWVDKGVDTGKIVSTRIVPVQASADCSTLDAVDQLLDREAVALLGEVVQSIYCGTVLNGIPQSNGRQYYKMPRRLERETARKLKNSASG